MEEVLAQGWQLGAPSEACRDVFAAYKRVRPHVRHTPLEPSAWLTKLGGCTSVTLKMESEQRTGSFKARGAVNKVLSLSPDEVRRGLVTSSSGNHALAFLYACSLLHRPSPTDDGPSHPTSSAGSQHGAALPAAVDAPAAATTAAAATAVLTATASAKPPSTDGGPSAAAPAAHAALPVLDAGTDGPLPLIYLPVGVSAFKLAKLMALKAEVVLHGHDVVEAEVEGRRVAEAAGGTFVSPYNDAQIMAGQGTIAIELLQSLRAGQVDTVLIPVGGGGLISGMAAVLKAVGPGVRVVGCQPGASDVMRRSVLAGHIVDIPSEDTLAEASAGGIEPGSLTLAPCMTLVDEWVTVSEDEIAAAMVGLLRQHSKLVEGAAGVAIASFIKLAAAGALAGRNVCIICCGGNIAVELLQRVLAAAGSHEC